MKTGRQVRLYGTGQHLLEIQGAAYPVEQIERKLWPPFLAPTVQAEPRFFTHHWCVVLEPEDIAKALPNATGKFDPHGRLFGGMSGSPVLDPTTGKIVGVFHTSATVQLDKERKDIVVLLFAGMDLMQPVMEKMYDTIEKQK